MLTLTYGYFKPQTNDKGSVWFPALEDNFQRLNDHTHDGTNSALLPSSSINKTGFSSTIAAVDWSGSAGVYTKLVTVPSGISGAATYNDITYYDIVVKNSSGDLIYPTITRNSASTFTVSVNDSSLALTIYYL